MRLSLSLFTFFVIQQYFTADGFSTPSKAGRIATVLFAEGGKPAVRTKPLTPEEILAEQRVKQGLPPEDEGPPKLFEDSLYDDIQQILIKLEHRVKEGPGSLSMLEVEEMSAMGNRVLVEMKDFAANGGNAAPMKSAAPAATAATVEAPPAQVQPTPQMVSPPVANAEVLEPQKIIDTSNDDGPAYTGTGGMGLASGTVNTYVIPGMDEMSPEEYQKALQDSISGRQAERKKTGVYGNRPVWDYLNSLTGESGILKEPEDGY